jgi:hypothetical protein
MSDLQMFRQVCYEAAKRTGGKVIEFRTSDGVTPNFHQAIVTYSDRTVAIVCLRDAALLAVALPRSLQFTPARDSGPLTFIDRPELTAALADAGARFDGFRILNLAELGGPIDAARWPGINSHDLRHWQPASLGETLFNYWD